MVDIKSLYTELDRLTELYNYYLTKALETIHYDERAYEWYLMACRNVRRQMANLEAHIKELENNM